MKYLDAVLDMPPELQHPMEEFLRSSSAVEREELLGWNTSGDGVEYALFYVEGAIDRYRERIDGVGSVQDVTLTPIDESSFYAYVCQETRPEDEAWRKSFFRRSLVVIPPLVYSDRGLRLTVVGASEDLQVLLSDLPENIDVTVEEISDYDRRHATIAGALTDRQLDAVETAVDLGYYDVPRTASLADVAAELGCAESTASNHLRKAEARVMRRLVGRGTPDTGPAAVQDAPRR